MFVFNYLNLQKSIIIMFKKIISSVENQVFDGEKFDATLLDVENEIAYDDFV